MTNPKKSNVEALLEQEAAILEERDAQSNPPICLELGCGKFALPDERFCEHDPRELDIWTDSKRNGNAKQGNSTEGNGRSVAGSGSMAAGACTCKPYTGIESNGRPVHRKGCALYVPLPPAPDEKTVCMGRKCSCDKRHIAPFSPEANALKAKWAREWNKKSCAETLANEAKEMSSDIGAKNAPVTTVPEVEFPTECMYGKMAEQAKQMRVHPGLAYPALLACWSGKSDIDEMCGTRVNVYAALCAPVGCGKNVAIKRSLAITDLQKGVEYKKAAPPGTRAFMELIGDKPSSKRGDKTRLPGPRKLLIATNEMTDVLKMTGIENSTLASRLCDIWDENEFEYPTAHGTICVDCRFSWVGGVPCSLDNPTRFTELFDAESSHGLYDRLILGYSDAKHNYKPWTTPETDTTGDDDYSFPAPPVTVDRLHPDAQIIYDSWNPEDGGSRIKQNCMKVAILTAMANGEREVSVEGVACAIKFMNWQIALRRVFQPGEAVNDQARCRTVILEAMERAGARTKFTNVKRLAHDRKWGRRFGDWIVKTAIKNLADMGELVPLIEGESGEKKKSETMFMLRDFSK